MVARRTPPLPAPDISNDMPEWRQGALCTQVAADLFFPEKGGSTREAKKICGRCDFTAECLDWALSHNELYGIWGGLSERERRPLPRVRQRQESSPCGTASGYRNHYRRKETPCQPCRDAESLRKNTIKDGAA